MKFPSLESINTVEPGISKLFQKHKKFTIARCLLSKGFDQKSNVDIISVLKSSQILNNMPIYYSRCLNCSMTSWKHLMKKRIFKNMIFEGFFTYFVY